jgi:anthranilate phosphoribosyltransferase
MVGELRDGQVREYDIHPEDFNLPMAASRNLRVENAAESKARVLEALDNKPGVARDIVALNAGAALYAAGVVRTIGEGLARARDVIAGGAARRKCDEFVAMTKKLATP